MSFYFLPYGSDLKIEYVRNSLRFTLSFVVYLQPNGSWKRSIRSWNSDFFCLGNEVFVYVCIYVCDFFFFISSCVICVRFGWEMCLIKLWFSCL